VALHAPSSGGLVSVSPSGRSTPVGRPPGRCAKSGGREHAPHRTDRIALIFCGFTTRCPVPDLAGLLLATHGGLLLRVGRDAFEEGRRGPSHVVCGGSGVANEGSGVANEGSGVANEGSRSKSEGSDEVGGAWVSEVRRPRRTRPMPSVDHAGLDHLTLSVRVLPPAAGRSTGAPGRQRRVHRGRSRRHPGGVVPLGRSNVPDRSVLPRLRRGHGQLRRHSPLFPSSSTGSWTSSVWRGRGF
jgi:hypothetical protein